MPARPDDQIHATAPLRRVEMPSIIATIEASADGDWMRALVLELVPDSIPILLAESWRPYAEEFPRADLVSILLDSSPGLSRIDADRIATVAFYHWS